MISTFMLYFRKFYDEMIYFSVPLKNAEIEEVILALKSRTRVLHVFHKPLVNEDFILVDFNWSFDRWYYYYYGNTII